MIESCVLFQISVTSGPASQEVLLYILLVQHFYKYFGCVAEKKRNTGMIVNGDFDIMWVNTVAFIWR
jgi:hypothetical protein